MRPYQDADRIATDPQYGRIVCFCERVTAGEIRDAFQSPIPPADLDGLRRRTRVMNGRCQGFYCGAHTQALLDAGGDGAMNDQHVAVAIVGGGPSGLTAAAALAVAGRRRGPGDRTRNRDRWNPPPQRPSRLRHARPQALHLRPGLRQAAHRDGAGCRRGARDRGDGHRLGRRARAAGHLTARDPHGHGRRGGAGHRRAGTAPARPAGARRPPRRGVHHRAAAEPRASAPRTRRYSRADRRRRTGQLVGGVDTARIRLRHRRNGQRLSARRGVCGVSGAGPGSDGRAGVHPQPARRHQRQGPGAQRGGGEHRQRSARPRSSATRWCSPATGSPTTNWPAPAAWRWIPPPAVRSWTPACGPAAPACSRSATCCTRSTPPTAPHWTDATWPPR